MAPGILLKALAVWAVILLLAVLNGALREVVLLPKLGAPWGLLLSGALLSALILAAAYLALPWFGTRQAPLLWCIGLTWVILTLVFEFSLGRWQGKSWSTLLEAYTFKGGNIWSLVLVVVVVAPVIAAKLRGWTPGANA